MFTKTNLIATVVAAIWSQMGGFLLWAVLADRFLNDHLGSATGVVRAEPDFGVLAIGCLVQAFAFSTVFRKWGAAHYNLMDGLKYGVWMGIFIGFGEGIIDYATSNVLDMTGALINGLIWIVHLSVMGLLVGLVYNRVK